LTPPPIVRTPPFLLAFIALAGFPAGAGAQELSTSPRYTVAVLGAGVRGEAAHYDRAEQFYALGIQGRVLSLGQPEAILEVRWFPEMEDRGPFRGQCGDDPPPAWWERDPDRVQARAWGWSVALLWQVSGRVPRLRIGLGAGMRGYRERRHYFCEPFLTAPVGRTHVDLEWSVRLRMEFGSNRLPWTVGLRWSDAGYLWGDSDSPGIALDGLQAVLTIPVVVWY
jgi:hypothetical protein